MTRHTILLSTSTQAASRSLPRAKNRREISSRRL